MIRCKVSSAYSSSGKYPYKIHGITREEYSVIMNFLNTLDLAEDQCEYSEVIMGDVVSQEEYEALRQNAELLGISLEITYE